MYRYTYFPLNSDIGLWQVMPPPPSTIYVATYTLHPFLSLSNCQVTYHIQSLPEFIHDPHSRADHKCCKNTRHAGWANGVGVDECHFSLFVFSPDAERADGGVQRQCHNSQHEHAIELSTLELWKRLKQFALTGPG